MQIEDMKKGDVVTDGAHYFLVHKVNRVTVVVEKENGYRITAYPLVFKGKADPKLYRYDVVDFSNMIFDHETEAAKRGFVLIRSDEGDGGWSLHTKAACAAADKFNDAPEALLSGTAEWNDEIGYQGDWNRPNAEDYKAATSANKDAA